MALGPSRTVQIVHIHKFDALNLSMLEPSMERGRWSVSDFVKAIIISFVLSSLREAVTLTPGSLSPSPHKLIQR